MTPSSRPFCGATYCAQARVILKAWATKPGLRRPIPLPPNHASHEIIKIIRQSTPNTGSQGSHGFTMSTCNRIKPSKAESPWSCVRLGSNLKNSFEKMFCASWRQCGHIMWPSGCPAMSPPQWPHLLSCRTLWRCATQRWRPTEHQPQRHGGVVPGRHALTSDKAGVAWLVDVHGPKPATGGWNLSTRHFFTSRMTSERNPPPLLRLLAAGPSSWRVESHGSRRP